jgi:hypothetical protein
VDQDSFGHKNPAPFLLLPRDNLPNYPPNPRSAESAGVEASPRFLDMGRLDKKLPQLEELVPLPNFVNLDVEGGHKGYRKVVPPLGAPK